MSIRSKSIYEEASPDDGVRMLVTNYWPRGVSRERAGLYKRVLAPSRPLLRAFKDGVIAWSEYEVRFLQEMRGADQREEIAALARQSRAETVTLLCACKDEAECHRRLLRELVEAEMAVQA